MKQLFLPEDYTSVLDVWQTEHAIKFIKDTFQLALAAELKLPDYSTYCRSFGEGLER